MPTFIIKANRYIDGHLHIASPQYPAEVTLPDIDPRTSKPFKFDRGLIPVGEAAAEPELKPHYAPSRGSQHPDRQVPVAAAAAPGGKPKRASDQSPT